MQQPKLIALCRAFQLDQVFYLLWDRLVLGLRRTVGHALSQSEHERANEQMTGDPMVLDPTYRHHRTFTHPIIMPTGMDG